MGSKHFLIESSPLFESGPSLAPSPCRQSSFGGPRRCGWIANGTHRARWKAKISSKSLGGDLPGEILFLGNNGRFCRRSDGPPGTESAFAPDNLRDRWRGEILLSWHA